MCHGSGAISSLFLLKIGCVAAVEIHGCGSSIESAPTLTTLGGRQRRNSSMRVDAPSTRWSKLRTGSHSKTHALQQVADLQRQLVKWCILVFLGRPVKWDGSEKAWPNGSHRSRAVNGHDECKKSRSVQVFRLDHGVHWQSSGPSQMPRTAGAWRRGECSFKNILPKNNARLLVMMLEVLAFPLDTNDVVKSGDDGKEYQGARETREHRVSGVS